MEVVYLLVEVVPFAVSFLLVVLRYDNSFPLPLAVVAGGGENDQMSTNGQKRIVINHDVSSENH